MTEPQARTPATARVPRWPSLLAGASTGLASWLVGVVLGAALGTSDTQPGDAATFELSALLGGVWLALAPVVALLAGGYVGARVAGPATRWTGALHGVVVWSVAALVGLGLLGAIGGGAAADAVATMRERADADFEVDAAEAVHAVNVRRSQAGLVPLGTEAVRDASRDTARAAAREGRLDRPQLVARLQELARLDEADALLVAAGIDRQHEAALTRVRAEALATAQRSSSILWTLFFVLVGGLVAAMIGGAAATRPPHARPHGAAG
jgi:hypothetical protein